MQSAQIISVKLENKKKWRGKPRRLASHWHLSVCLFWGLCRSFPIARPAEFSALSFAFFLSLWQLVFSVPTACKTAHLHGQGHLQRQTPLKTQAPDNCYRPGDRHDLWAFNLCFCSWLLKRPAPSAHPLPYRLTPLFAILWETLFLKRRKSALELAFTFLLLAALYYLATGGTWRVAGFSFWFVVALGIPFLWSIAHVILKEVMDKTPRDPGRDHFFSRTYFFDFSSGDFDERYRPGKYHAGSQQI